MATPTPAEIVAACDTAVLALVQGAQSYDVLGRRVTKADLGEIRRIRSYFADLDAGSDDKTGGTALVVFGKPA